MTTISRSTVVKLAVLLLLVLLAILLLHGEAPVGHVQDVAPFAINIDVGSDHDSRDHSGRLYLTDQEWTPETPYGFIGGYRVWNSSKAHPTDGTPDEFLHTNQRFNWEEYRFSNIPNGDYLITLSFSEIGVPYVTVFDVAIEGQTVLDDFRIYDYVGGNYALTRRFATAVRDGELNVTAVPVIGDPRLASIDVISRSTDKVAPAVPSGLLTTSSYGAVLLDWTDNTEEDLEGYHVFRATASDGPYERLTTEPAYLSRYQDASAVPHTVHFYCISALDVFGNESDLSACESGFALQDVDATLPLYELDIHPEDLVDLYSHALSDEEINGIFTYNDQAYRVTLRYRGGYGRYVHKRSWKIRFPDSSPFPGQDQINLRADYIDPTLMHSKIATDLFDAGGVQVPEAEYVLLMLNGEYWGVYIANEQVDEAFLAHRGLNPNTSIYKAVDTETHDWSKAQPSKQAYYKAFEKKTNRDMNYDDIIAFLELINNTSDETFAYELSRVFDVASFLDYYAITILISNGDFVHHNTYLLHDLDADQWRVVPYDFDVVFNITDRPINEGTASSPIQPREWVSVLLTRLLDVPQYRAYYCRQLADFMGGIFSEAAMDTFIHTNYRAIEQDGLRDWHKYHREVNDWFIAGPDTLKTYVSERRDFLLGEMAAYCPVAQPYLSINEVMINNLATLEDPDETSEFPAWFEIHNQGLDAVDLSGMYLTNDLTEPAKFEIAEGISIPAGGFIIFYADGDPEQGPLHTNFKLDAQTEQIAILNNSRQIDSFSFGLHPPDTSEGRFPDGGKGLQAFDKPTPGRSNILLRPAISGTTHTPWFPTASEIVTVTTTITDDSTWLTATLHFSAAAPAFTEIPMERVSGNLYSALVPPQPAGSLVRYYISARDSENQLSLDPLGAPHALNSYIVDYEPPTVFINEFQANSVRGSDVLAESTDWIELYNPGPEPKDLGGRYLTDDLKNPMKYRIPDGTIVPASGFLHFWADNSPDLGAFHTNFRLDKNGGSIGLFDIEIAGSQPIDVYTFGPQASGVSEGRCPDANVTWVFFSSPTPGNSNSPCGTMSVISKVRVNRPTSFATESISITAVIVDNSAIVTPTLWYGTKDGFRAVPMNPLGADVYAATITALSEGTTAAFYIEAENGLGVSIIDPPGAPIDVYKYAEGYRPPPLFINEFMADNVRTLEDPDEAGEFPDWIELFNSATASIDLSGKYLTDDLTDPTKFRIPDGVIVPSGGFVVFFADDDPQQGLFHTTLKLDRNGEEIGLFDVDATGNQPIDTYVFGWQPADLSEQRHPDGGDVWLIGQTPTPGRPNATIQRTP